MSAEWLQGAEAGVIRAAAVPTSHRAVRSYEASLRLRVYGPDAPMEWLGDEPLEDIQRADLQELVDRLTLDVAPKTAEAPSSRSRRYSAASSSATGSRRTRPMD